MPPLDFPQPMATLHRPFSRFIVAVDASPASEGAARLAISLARGDRTAEVVFCHAIDVNQMLVQADRQFDDFPLALTVARDAARELLDQCCALARESGVFGRSYLRDGKPVNEVAWLADALRADLVVIGNRPSAKIRRVLLGSTRDEMVRASRLPILVADADPSRPADFGPRCILAPAEDSRGSVNAARLAAAEMATAYSARLVVLPPGNGTIDRAAGEHQPDVIVIGAAPRDRLRDLFSANAVERLLQEYHGSVLVVPDAWHPIG